MLRTEAFGKCMLLRNGQARMTWCRAYSDYTDRTKVWARLHFKALRAPSTVTAPSALRHPLQSFTPLSPALMSAMYTIRCCEITIYECNSAKDTQRKAKLEKRRIVTQVSKKKNKMGSALHTLLAWRTFRTTLWLVFQLNFAVDSGEMAVPARITTPWGSVQKKQRQTHKDCSTHLHYTNEI